ncbi:MAG: metallophosphoesterase [Myxococcota bacterium]
MYPPGPHASRNRRIETIPRETNVWIISDLHLGDGTPSDAFFGKDRYLMALVERVERDGATLIVNGDAIDFAQAWTLSRVLRAHGPLLGALSRLGRNGRLFYVVGNHDMDLTLFRDVLNFRVCDALEIGDEVLVCHGYEFDPYIGTDLYEADMHTKVHHAIERWLGAWIRLPLHEFYNPVNRFVFWLAHKIIWLALAWCTIASWLGQESSEDEVRANANFWAWGNEGDSMGIFRPAMTYAQQGKHRFVLCGHSHVPGVVRQANGTYANSGSWTFASAQYLHWNGRDVRCFDWVSGREFEAELYEHMADGSLYERDFMQWWRENYLGGFRFRKGEARRGKTPAWKQWLRDHQHLSRMRELPHGPLLPPHEVPKDVSTENPEGPSAHDPPTTPEVPS